MTVQEFLLEAFDLEMSNTRKLLEAVPEEHLDWKPHEKSSSLRKLASHVAALPALPGYVLGGQIRKPFEAGSKAELLAALEENIALGREAIASATDDQLNQVMPVGPGISRRRATIVQRMALHHMVHHRGQLSVYLRLLGVAVPGMYGPSADGQ